MAPNSSSSSSSVSGRSGIYTYSAIAVPQRVNAPQAEPCMHWLRHQVAGAGAVASDREVDMLAAQHPSFGMLAAFGFAKLEQSDKGVRLADINISVGSEVQALALANSFLGQGDVFSITYAGHDSVGKMVGARTLMRGLRLANRQRSSAQSNLDLSDIVSLGGLAPIPPLAIALAQLHPEAWRSELTMSETIAALQVNEHRPLIRELLWRLWAIGRTYVSMYVSRDCAIEVPDTSYAAGGDCSPASDQSKGGQVG